MGFGKFHIPQRCAGLFIFPCLLLSRAPANPLSIYVLSIGRIVLEYNKRKLKRKVAEAKEILKIMVTPITVELQVPMATSKNKDYQKWLDYAATKELSKWLTGLS